MTERGKRVLAWGTVALLAAMLVLVCLLRERIARWGEDIPAPAIGAEKARFTAVVRAGETTGVGHIVLPEAPAADDPPR